jgi:hypothetical protein
MPLLLSIAAAGSARSGLVKNPYHSGTLAPPEGALTRVSLSGSKTDKPAAAKMSGASPADADDCSAEQTAGDDKAKVLVKKHRRELGGPEGPDPTRYGDWERKGRCIDF